MVRTGSKRVYLARRDTILPGTYNIQRPWSYNFSCLYVTFYHSFILVCFM